LERAEVRRIKSSIFNSSYPSTSLWRNTLLPLLLERAGVRRIKSSFFNSSYPRTSL